MGPAVFGMGGKSGGDILKGQSLNGHTAVITGANSGIGREMTRLLALAGCRVIMVVRNLEKGEFAAKELRESFPGGAAIGELVVMKCNLASFEQIRNFAAQLQHQKVPINYLILNAAVKATPKWYTKEGIELQMGVNFIGHFHLVQLLLPYMKAHLIEPARIVCITCRNEMDGTLRMTDLNFSKVHYDPLTAYKGSKIAMALFAKELANRAADSHISVYAADPGPTGDTMINKFSPMFFAFAFSKPFLKNVSQAAATPLFACVAPDAAQHKKRRALGRHSVGIKSGSLLADCKVVTGNKYMGSAHLARRVWEEAEQMVNRSVINSHAQNQGFEGNTESLWILNTFLKPMFDFLLRMFGLQKY